MDELLEFWFGPRGSAEFGRVREMWFKKDPVLDDEVRQRFASLHAAAAAHELDDWRSTPRGCLALIVLLDQISRNLFRDSPHAFACDAQALDAARYAIATGCQLELLAVERMFLYMPFMHSENLADQRWSLELFDALRDEPEMGESVEYARRHYEIIARFGRFPHRNRIVGRDSTAGELAYLRQPGSGF